MKRTLFAVVFTACSLLGSSAYAANAGCEAQATEKKLAGAARTSFMKKCERDAGSAAKAGAAAMDSPACEKSAADKKLAGAAKTGHIKKCMADEAAAKK